MTGLTVALLVVAFFGALLSAMLIDHRARAGEDATPAFLCLVLNILAMALNGFYLGQGFPR